VLPHLVEGPSPHGVLPFAHGGRRVLVDGVAGCAGQAGTALRAASASAEPQPASMREMMRLAAVIQAGPRMAQPKSTVHARSPSMTKLVGLGLRWTMASPSSAAGSSACCSHCRRAVAVRRPGAGISDSAVRRPISFGMSGEPGS
jgi:hypothetical protein